MAEFEFRARNPESSEPQKREQHVLSGSTETLSSDPADQHIGNPVQNFDPPNFPLNNIDIIDPESVKPAIGQGDSRTVSSNESSLVMSALIQTVGWYRGNSSPADISENPFQPSGTIDATPSVEPVVDANASWPITDATAVFSPDVSDRTSPHHEAIHASDELPFPPRRSGSHMGGSQFFTRVLGIDVYGKTRDNGVMGIEREKAILEQIEAGNIPDFLRTAKKIVVRDNAGNVAELMVMPDYLAIGMNEDFVRVPVTPVLARAIADRYGLSLPTRKVVDDIYSQADVRARAVGLVQSPVDFNFMQGNGYYAQHNRLIEKHLKPSDHGSLIAGHKKDIIVSRYVQANPDRLDFYGFFDAQGHPIQGSGGGAHDNIYVDYSHGIRFVSSTVIVNGRPMRYDDVLRSPKYARLLSSEGPLDVSGIYMRPVRPAYSELFV